MIRRKICTFRPIMQKEEGYCNYDRGGAGCCRQMQRQRQPKKVF